MQPHFYNTIFHLRSDEEIILYNRMLSFSPGDEQLVQDFLAIEYQQESQHYPYLAPAFNGPAALWAAKIIYTVCQLVLHREDREVDLPELLPQYHAEIDAAAILSADLCLRFLPQVVKGLKNIDIDDALIKIVEQHLLKWHYSGVGYNLDTGLIELDKVIENDCLLKLYADRVMQQKDLQRALMPPIKNHLKATMGIYSNFFWKELNQQKTDE